jgi:ubiquinone/menaquinone biosynthesis C-methylase UbiE
LRLTYQWIGLTSLKHKVAKVHIANVKFLQSNGISIQLEDNSIDLIILVIIFHEIGDYATVLKEFFRVLKLNGRLGIIEAIKKSIIPGAPIQNTQTIEAEVSEANFKLQQLMPYKNYGIFFSSKNNQQQSSPKINNSKNIEGGCPE